MDKKAIYIDAAASALKPESVIRAESDFLRNHYANSGRGVCARADAVDKMTADSRIAVAGLVGARPEQIVFTSGATDGLNRIPRILEASSALAGKPLVLASDLDHHSARLPWEALARLGKCRFQVAPLDKEYNIDAAAMRKADVLVITAMSNVIGTPQNVKDITARARMLNPNVITIVDAAQHVAHLPIDVRDWDCDFLCFSGHKIGADTGIGVMYMKDPNRWHPDKFGGGMVSSVADNEWIFAPAPAKFEAGTLPLTQICGLKEAIRELATLRADALRVACATHLRAELSKIPRIKFISPAGAHLLTFVIDGMHPLDFGALMGAKGVCLRVGNMCASWLHRALGIPGSIRISPGPWNTMEEMEEVIKIVKEVIK